MGTVVWPKMLKMPLQGLPAKYDFWDLEKIVLGVVHKLRLQDEVV